MLMLRSALERGRIVRWRFSKQSKLCWVSGIGYQKLSLDCPDSHPVLYKISQRPSTIKSMVVTTIILCSLVVASWGRCFELSVLGLLMLGENKPCVSKHLHWGAAGLPTSKSPTSRLPPPLPLLRYAPPWRPTARVHNFFLRVSQFGILILSVHRP